MAKSSSVRRKVRVAAEPRAPEPDEYGASGGMPFAKASISGDRSRARRTQELTWAEFDRQVHRLAKAAVGFKPQAVVGIAHGGVFVGGAVASALKAEFFPVRLTSRSRDRAPRLAARASDEMPKELSGKRVLILDDICSSGDSLELAARLAKAVGALKVKTAALVTRPHGPAPDYVGLTTDALFVFPWDYQAVVEDERFEQKPARTMVSKQKRGKGPGVAAEDDDAVLGV